MSAEPEFVDLETIPLVADEDWYLQAVNGNGAAPYDPATGWVARSLASVADEPPTRPELALGILYPGKRHVFSGPQESAKTLAAYICGLSVVRDGSPIVLVDMEMGEYDAKKRFREIGATDAELEQISYVEPQTPASPKGIEALIALRPALVIVDAAAGAFQVEGLDDNSRRDVETWAQAWVNPFWRAKIATLVLDHVTKNTETRGNYAIGSERKVGGADVHIGFGVIEAIARGTDGRYKLTTHKDRGGFLRRGKLGELVLQSDPDSHLISHAFEPFDESQDSDEWFPYGYAEKISHYLEHQVEPVSLSDVSAAVTGKKERLVQAVNGLVREGFVTESKGAHGARLFELVSAFRESAFRPVPVPFPAVPEMDESSRSLFPLSRGEQENDDVPFPERSERVVPFPTDPEPEIPF